MQMHSKCSMQALLSLPAACSQIKWCAVLGLWVTGHKKDGQGPPEAVLCLLQGRCHAYS